MTIPEQAVEAAWAAYNGKPHRVTDHERMSRAIAAALPLMGVQRPESISPSDPLVTIAGIRQFGLASDGSDLRDLEAAFTRLARSRTGQPLDDLNFIKAFWRAQPSCLHLACDADCNPKTTHCGRAAEVAAERNELAKHTGQPQEGWRSEANELIARAATILSNTPNRSDTGPHNLISDMATCLHQALSAAPASSRAKGE